MFLSIAHTYFFHDMTTYWQLCEVMRIGVCVNVNTTTRDGAAGGCCGRRSTGCDG